MSKERDGKLQPTNDLAEAVTSAHVVEAVAKQKRVDLVEQMLYMDPIKEIGVLSAHPCLRGTDFLALRSPVQH